MEKNKLSLDELEEKTGVNRETIADIYWGARWKSISCNYKVKNYDKLPINSSKKYNEEQIEEACRLLFEGCSNKETAKITGLSRDCVKRLKSGKTHKHISAKFGF